MLSRVMRSTVGRTILRIVLGQFLAMCMSVTGLFTTLLVEDNSSLPLLQSVTAYSMICVLFFFVYAFFIVRNKDYINQKYVTRASNDLHLDGKDVKRPDSQQKRENQAICSDLLVSSDCDGENAMTKTDHHRPEEEVGSSSSNNNSNSCKNMNSSAQRHQYNSHINNNSITSKATPLISNSSGKEREEETGDSNADRNGNNINNSDVIMGSSGGYTTFSPLSPSHPRGLIVKSYGTSTSSGSKDREIREQGAVISPTAASSSYPFISSTLNTIKQYFTSSLSSGYKGVGSSLWRFAIIALIDLEANFAVVYAYQHTDITSVQLLDCSSIVWVMILSRFLLGTRYKPLWHLVGAGVAAAGIILLIVFDATNMNRHAPSDNEDGGGGGPANMTVAAISSYFFSSTSTGGVVAAASGGGFSNSHLFLSAKQEDPTAPPLHASDHSKRDIILGDMLCIVSSLLYAISNVMCERLVKKSVESAEGESGEENENEEDEQKRGLRKEEEKTCEERVESGNVQQQQQQRGTLVDRNGKSLSLLQKEEDRRLRDEISVAEAEAVQLHSNEVIVTNKNNSCCNDQHRDVLCEDPCDGQTSVREHPIGSSGIRIIVGSGEENEGKHQQQRQASEEAARAYYHENTKKSGEKTITITSCDFRDPNLCGANSSRENSREASLLETTLDDRFIPSLEWIVIIEYLFWMPFFGALFGSIQFWATGEFKNLPQFFTSPSGSSEVPAFDRVSTGESYVDLYYQFGFGGAMLVIYTLMPVLFYVASATFANLSLLTSDIFSVFWNVVIFGIYPKPTFFISFVLILAGVVLFDTNGLEALRRQRRRG